ncbi:D-sedoheptulose 7-phosphate isomerase [Mucilaginibacter straminoryzae]|uniref:D-sedoheptulose 7-phosphate isomerase n=1 Tax=Mucilaginibacter straminoryzae TaxID=2932774 RepID=UPI0021D4589D|nr:D-sedoheptulose 7-phosphate isomerase [Mucilaginibacter straminoryzae]
MEQFILTEINEHRQALDAVLAQLVPVIGEAAKNVINAVKKGNKVLIFGNGGSAADAQHIAAEFTGRFVKERRGLPAIALTTDTSAMTAISNDYGYARIFARQVEALAVPGDVVIGISTSGNSENVIKGLEAGKQIGCYTLGLSGRDGGAMNSLCDLNIVIPVNTTARVQEMHILIGHILCAAIDNEF